MNDHDNIPLIDDLNRPISQTDAIRQLQDQITDLQKRFEDLDADLTLIELHIGLRTQND